MTQINSPLEPLLRKLQHLTQFDDEDRDALLALPHSIRSFQAGNYLVRQGERPRHCCVLLSGFAFRQKLVPDGARQIVSLHVKGDVVDLQNAFLPIADHNVQALGHVTAAVIPIDAIISLAFDRPAIGKAMWTDTLIDASIFREWIVNVGRRNARTRVLHFLCEFAVRQEEAGLARRDCFELPLTQEQIADATGLTSVHVNRVLRSLEQEAILERQGRIVSIPNWAVVADQAGFGEGYLHPRLKENEAR